MQFNSVRLHFVDDAKGLAIYSVILVHLNTFLDWDSQALTYVIHSYFMPLFFFISGYLCFKNEKIDIHLFINKKIKQLIVPFFTSSLAICVLYSIMFDITLLDRYIFDSSKGGYWFLIVLFIFNCIYVLCVLVISSIKININKGILFVFVLLFIWLLLCMISMIISEQISYLFSLSELRRFYPSFFLGILAKKYISNVNIWDNKVMCLSGLTYFLLLFYGYNDKTVVGFFMWLIASISACLFILNLFRLINKSVPLLSTYGRNSLGIYIYHYIFIYILKLLIPISLLNKFSGEIILLSFIFLSFIIAELSIILIRLTNKLKISFIIGA